MKMQREEAAYENTLVFIYEQVYICNEANNNNNNDNNFTNL